MRRTAACLLLFVATLAHAECLCPGGIPQPSYFAIETFFANGTTDLPTSAASVYYGLGRHAEPNATETTADLRTPVAAMRFYGITCAVNQIGTGSDGLTFTLRDDAANVTGVTCSMVQPAVTCTTMLAAPVAVAAGSFMAIQATGVSSPTATSGACIVFGSIDTVSG
jgi:hypothetical protein